MMSEIEMSRRGVLAASAAAAALTATSHVEAQPTNAAAPATMPVSLTVNGKLRSRAMRSLYRHRRKPRSGCAAIGGYSRQLAVIGSSDQCIATYPGDMAVAMRVLDATVETVKANGTTRAIPIADFHRLPGNTPDLDNSLEAGKLITAVTLPRPLGGSQYYEKVRDRASYAFALVSVAAVTGRAFANARPTDDNVFKIPLATRALAATIAEGKSA